MLTIADEKSINVEIYEMICDVHIVNSGLQGLLLKYLRVSDA